MARYICPCCGQSFNGKRCRNCYYETFDDEISRNLHTHQEVNTPDVPKIPASRPAQVQREWEQQKREFRRQQEARRKGGSRRSGKLPKGVLWLLVVFLLNPVLSMAGLVVEEISDAVSDISISTREPDLPDAALPENAELLFSGEGFELFLGRTEAKQTYSLYLRNTTSRDVRLSARRILVDGFLSERSNVWCEAPAGTLREGELWLDEEDMAWAVVNDPCQITLELAIYDAEEYEDILEADVVIENGGIPLAVTPEGEMLLDTDTLFLSYLGYQANSYAPESVWDGTMAFYLENRTGELFSVYTEEVLVNGEEAQLNLWSELPAGTRTVSRMWLFGLEDLEIEKLEQLKSLELHLTGYGEAGTVDFGWITVNP